MKINRRTWVLAAFLALVLAVMAVGEKYYFENRTPPPCDCESPSTLEDQYTPLARGPVSTYNQACAHCHGINGTAYGPELAQRSTQELLAKVDQMMRLYIQPAPDEAEVAAMTAYHLAIARQKPFICITGLTFDSLSQVVNVQGESSPGSTTLLTGRGNERSLSTDSLGKWQFSQTYEESLQLKARSAQDSAYIQLGQQQWSSNR